MTWSVPRLWAGQPGFILGGGSSLRGFDAEILRGRGRVIGIKEAGLTMAPWCDVLYWADKFWCDGDSKHPANGPRLHLHKGKFKITRGPVSNAKGHDVKVLISDQKMGLSADPTKLGGVCSGGNSINLAYLFGCDPIVLLGFDMKGDNWDGRPRRAQKDKAYEQRFMPAIARMAAPLQQHGVTVLNATPGSALGCFPKITLEEVLARTPRKPMENSLMEGAPGVGRRPIPVGEPADDSPDNAAPEQGAPAEQAAPAAVVAPDSPDNADLPLGEAPAPAAPQAVAASETVEPPKLEEVTGLELRANPMEIAHAITDLARRPAIVARIRIVGADIVVRRSGDWWRRQLGVVFPIVIEHPSDAREVLFECRNPRA